MSFNLMDDEGELVFIDQQATRMERSIASLEISFRQGGYQIIVALEKLK